jgi:tRNA-binding protein
MDSNLYNKFTEIDIRVGKIIKAEKFPEAQNASYKLIIDFGDELGTMKSSAQITNYMIDELNNRLCIAIVNLPEKQVGPFISECLILGSVDINGEILLLEPDSGANLGDRIS